MLQEILCMALIKITSSAIPQSIQIVELLFDIGRSGKMFTEYVYRQHNPAFEITFKSIF